jgi:hypothetical protein
MFHSKLRRPLAALALVFAVSLLPAQAAAAPRAGGEREGRRVLHWIERWEHLAWDFLTGLMEKRGSDMNPDGLRAQRTPAPVEDEH